MFSFTGQFLHRSVIVKKTKNRKGKLMGRLRVSGNTMRPRKVMSTLGHRLNLAANKTVSCWMVQHNGGALLDGNITDYLIKTGDQENTGHTFADTADDIESVEDDSSRENVVIDDDDVDIVDVEGADVDKNDIVNDFNTITDAADRDEDSNNEDDSIKGTHIGNYLNQSKVSLDDTI